MKKLNCLFTVMSASALLTLPQNVFSASILDLLVTSEGLTYQESYSSVEDVINGIDEDYIRQQISNYTDQSDVSGTINFRGVSVALSFTKDSTELTLNIPTIGVQEIFIGGTRDDSVDQLEEWFKSEGGDALTDLMQSLAASTANDPIAGNPNSLMANIVQSDYDSAFTSTVSNVKQSAEVKTDATASTSNLMGIGARFGSYQQDDLDSQHLFLPLSYTVLFDNSFNTLKFKMPVAMTNVDGAESYSLGFGIELGLQVTDNWRLTPSVNYGTVASIDLGSVGQIASGSVTSASKIEIGNCELSMGNMVGYYKTLEFSYDEYSFDPEIANTVIRNGLMLSIPTENILNSTSLELFVTDTRYSGSDLYIDSYDEIGFSFGSTKNEGKSIVSKIKNYLRVGVTYLYSDESKGFSANFGYTF